MKRRNFLHTAGTAISIPFLLNGMPLTAARRSALSNVINQDTDKVLVIIQLNGGNDGLNTIIPLDQYDGLAAVRPNILIPENAVQKITDTVGLHPNLKSLQWIYEQGKVGIVNSVGYPNQNRSHFRSTDIWTSGSPADEFWQTGWLGRHFDGQYPGFPDEYPNAEHPDPFAITMGRIVSETCQGIAGNFSMTLNDPFSLSPLLEGADSSVPETPYGEELDFLRTTIAQTNAYSESITDAANKGATKAIYPEDNNLANQLRNVALLVSGGLRTKVYICSIGGFDTHANQVEGSDPTLGEHAMLLNTLSDAIGAFQQDLEMLGLEQRVMGMTFSEFGRRIRSNDSLGTDHGTAAPLIMFGSCVNPIVLGDNPEISADISNQEGVPMQHDFRDVYGSVLKDWFEVPEEEVKQILHEDFQYLPVISVCQTTTSTEERLGQEIELSNYPNPMIDGTTITFKCERAFVRLSVYDALGSEIAVLVNKALPAGNHEVRWNASNLAAGTYFYRIQLEGGIHKTKRVVKVK